ENMAYVSLLALLLLEHEPARSAALRESERRLWERMRGEHNAFFAAVHVLASGDPGARAEAAAALAEFPERKLELPVDLTRPGFSFEQRWWKNAKGEPRATSAIPLYLRPAGSNLWVDDPFGLVGSLRDDARTEYSGIDYLLAYWLARARGIVASAAAPRLPCAAPPERALPAGSRPCHTTPPLGGARPRCAGSSSSPRWRARSRGW